MKKEAIIFYLLVFLLILAKAEVFEDKTESDFNNGTFYRTFYNVSISAVQLNLSEGFSGNFTSRIFNANSIAEWKNISWVQEVCYKCELPNNQAQEIGDFVKPADMSDNVLLLHLNEASGTTFTDSSGNGNNGSCSGINCPTLNVSGKFNNARSFDGIDDFISVPDSDSLDITNDISIEVWTYATDLQAGPDVVTKGDFTESYSLWYRPEPATGQVAFALNDDRLYSNSNLSENRWHYVVATREGNEAKIYIDGVLDATNDTFPDDIIETNNKNLSVSSSIYNFSGIIDEVAIYNRSLSAGEIREHYLRGISELNLSIKSCGDSDCIGESFNTINGSSPQNISISNNPYFQYKFDFLTEDTNFSSHLYNVSIGYEIADTTPPLVTINFPQNTTYKASDFPLNFNVSLNENGSVIYSLDNGINNITMLSDDNINFNATNSSMADGSYIFSVYANDTAGNNNYTERITFSVDTTAPLVTINLPQNTTYNSMPILFNITTNEDANANYTLDNGINNITMQNNGNRDFNATNSSMADGSYTVRFYVWDTIGNLNSSEQITFSVDISSTNIQITYPQNATYNLNITELNYTISGTNLQACWYSLNFGITNITITCGNNITNISSNEGSNTWSVYANDSLGNINESSVTFSVDTAQGTTPIVNISYPSYASTYGNASNISLNFSAISSNLQSCWYSLDEGETNFTLTACTNTTFNVSSNGVYNITVYSNETVSGETGKDTVEFHVNHEKPTVHLLSPVNKYYTNSTEVNFNYIPSANLNLQGCELWGDFSGNFSLNQTNSSEIVSGQENSFLLNLTEGDYIWAILCEDEAGNAITGNRTLISDFTKPNITDPASAAFDEGNVTLSYAVNDSSPVTCTYDINASSSGQVVLNGTEGCQNTILNINFIAESGEYVSTLNAQDAAGNTQVSQITINVQVSGGSGGGSSGGGGSSTNIVINSPPEIAQISYKQLEELKIRRGQGELISLEITNTGTKFLNRCKLQSNEFKDWIINRQVESISPGEKVEYVFTLNVPSNAEARRYNTNLEIVCDEINSAIPLVFNVLTNDFEFLVLSSKREDNKINVDYFLEDKLGKKQEILIKYSFINQKEILLLDNEELVSLEANEKKEAILSFELPKGSVGQFILKFEVSNERESLVVEHPVSLPSPRGLTGLVIFTSEENKKILSILGVLLLVVMLGYISFKFLLKHQKRVELFDNSNRKIINLDKGQWFKSPEINKF